LEHVHSSSCQVKVFKVSLFFYTHTHIHKLTYIHTHTHTLVLISSLGLGVLISPSPRSRPLKLGVWMDTLPAKGHTVFVWATGGGGRSACLARWTDLVAA